MQQRSDEALMKAYAGGDMKAFEVLYGRHRGPLYRYILRQVGEPATANDLYQQSWEKVIRSRHRFRESSPFQAWMYRIARNNVIDHFRRQKPLDKRLPDEVEAPGPGPEERTDDVHRQQDLERALQELPDEQKEVLLLKLESGLNLKTIADVVGINQETAKSRLRYAVSKLRACLAKVRCDDDGPHPQTFGIVARL